MWRRQFRVPFFVTAMPPTKTNHPKKFIYREGYNEYGPFTSDELRHEARSGRLTPNAYVRRENEDRWLSAISMASLASDFEAAKTQPSPFPEERVSARTGNKDRLWEFARNNILGVLFVLAILIGVIVMFLPEPLSPADKRIVDGRSVYEWNQLTKVTVGEESGVVYNLLMNTLKRHSQRPSSVRLIGGHQAEALGCQLTESPKYQSHVCSGRFRFKNGLGVSDETTYEIYFRKYEDGTIELENAEISGRIVEIGRQ